MALVWVGEWANTGSVSVLLFQGNYSHAKAGNGGVRSPIKSPIRSPTQKGSMKVSLTSNKPNIPSSMPEMLRDASSRKLTLESARVKSLIQC